MPFRNVTVRRGQQLKSALEQFPEAIVTDNKELRRLYSEGWRLRELSGISPLYRSEWGPWHATREFIQNALDAGSNVYEFIHVENGIIISDKGSGITLEHLVLGQFKEDAQNLAARGRFGEGLKLACVTLLRLGHQVEINTVNYDFVPVFYVKLIEDPALDEQFEELTFGFLYKQNKRTSGTDVMIQGLDTSYSDLILTNHTDSIIASFDVTEPEQRARNVGSITQAELVAPYYRKSHNKSSPCLYVKDIWIQDLDKEFYTYSYNFAFVISPKASTDLDPEVQPNRDAVNQKAIDWAINRLWTLIIINGEERQELVVKWLQSLVDVTIKNRSKLSVKETDSIDPFEWKLWSVNSVYGGGPKFTSSAKIQVALNIVETLKQITYKNRETDKTEPFPPLERIVFIESGLLERRARVMGYVPIGDLFDWHGTQILGHVFNELDIPKIEEKELLELMEVKGIQTIPEHKLTRQQVQVLHNVNIIVSRLYDNRDVVYNALKLDDLPTKAVPHIKLSDGLTDMKTEIAVFGKHIPGRNEIVLDWSNSINRDPHGTTRFMFATLMHEFSHWIRNSPDGTEAFREDLEAVWHLNSQLYAVDRVYKKAVDALLVKSILKKFLKLLPEE